jgi:hypothetical protein
MLLVLGRLLGAAVLFEAWPARAMFARMTEAELFARSDLVVVGLWIGQTDLTLTASGPRQGIGAIAVAEVLKGPVGTTLALLALPAVGSPRSSSDPSFRPGDRGAWCLRARPGPDSGLYFADHPQRYARLPEEAATVETLRRLAAAAR